jgi:uncharacterized protein (TIGR03083 family)
VITREPDPIYTTHLFTPMRHELLHVLRDLTNADWNRPTACPGWTVKDVALHMLGGDIGLLSGRRDGFFDGQSEFESFDHLVAFINLRNDIWMRAARRISPSLLIELLAVTGEGVADWMTSLDPDGVGAPVDWAGDGPAPQWMELAREHTEYWTHHQHICDAVGISSLKEPTFMGPTLAAFIRSLPRAYANVESRPRTLITVEFTGAVEQTWHLMREMGQWRLFAHTTAEPTVFISLPDDTAWRLFTKGLTPDEALTDATIEGDVILANPFFEAVAILA